MRRLFFILNTVLITSFIYLSVEAFYKVASTKLNPGTRLWTSPQKNISFEIKTIPPRSHYRPITDRNLFNLKVEIPSKPGSVAIESLKQTNLKVKLWGTVTGADGESFAVIEEARGRKQNLYREGDTIQNAMVKMILREKVILDVGGKDEILEMEKIQSRSITPKRAASAPRRPQSLPPRNIILKRGDIIEALRDRDALMKQVNIRPFLRAGRPNGLLLTGIRPHSISRKMRLRNGDLLIGVDAKDLQSVDEAFEFYQNLESATSTTI
ncbi:MAG: hypothetical protein JRI77_11880, partial [Deltaproteobacteria bacterium]|nr:hypothetical protein [Deltaproteobacteria bacterium]